MKNTLLLFASVLSIALTMPVIDNAISEPILAKRDRLPKIGIVKSPDRGNLGCFYWQSGRTTRKLDRDLDNAIKKIMIASPEYQNNIKFIEREAWRLDRKAIFSDFFNGGNNSAKMNLNGNDTLLKFVSSKEVANKNYQSTYKINSIIINLTNSSSSVFKLSNGVAAVYERGSIFIKNINNSKSFEIRGFCFLD
jgi:hypothetical protein